MLEGSEIVVTQRELLIAVVLAALIYLVASVLAAWRGARRARRAEAMFLADPGPATASATEMAEMRERLAKLGERVAALEGMLGAPAEADPGIDDPVYGPAARMVKQGMPVDEVASRLGLSRAEIDLIEVLHGKHAPGKPH
jgi:hypothetical protein